MGLNHYSPVILQFNPLQPGELSFNPLQPGEHSRKIRYSPVILHENPLQPGDSTIKFISASAFPVKSITARWFSSKIHSSPVILQLNPFQPPFRELSVNFRWTCERCEQVHEGSHRQVQARFVAKLPYTHVTCTKRVLRYGKKSVYFNHTSLFLNSLSTHKALRNRDWRARQPLTLNRC